jgi:prolyl-tRNA synthetase
MYKQWINSWRDLPILINQWANIVRWEMRTRLFLRTSEFLWQEGHTAHATEAEAREETLKILDIYREVAETEMALPAIAGLKSEAEKFAGAVDTWAIETMMGDGRALQSGTSHFLGQNFARAFDVTFRNEANEEEYVWATSWGVSTRLIGAVIMAHGDDQGLRLPPRIAPVQAVIVPIYKDDSRDSVLAAAGELTAAIEKTGVRVKLDDRPSVSPGFKFNEWEMKGVPLRLEIGPKDVAAGQAVLVRRDNGEKNTLELTSLAEKLPALLEDIQNGLFNQALAFREEHTREIDNWDDFTALMETGGFAVCGWDGDPASEAAIQEQTKATIRVILHEESADGLKCIYSGQPAQHKVVIARAY